MFSAGRECRKTMRRWASPVPAPWAPSTVEREVHVSMSIRQSLALGRLLCKSFLLAEILGTDSLVQFEILLVEVSCRDALCNVFLGQYVIAGVSIRFRLSLASIHVYRPFR
eukprot:m.636494 g.636494  ORF g.636494 m.636494 type:complete len:111 (+) comp22593_c0_seq3:2280-2612(+)